MMGVALTLVPSDVIAEPVGLMASASHLEALAQRQARLNGFWLAQCGPRFILFSKGETTPQLPWLGTDIGYLQRLLGTVYCPVHALPNAPRSVWSSLFSRLRALQGLTGPLVMVPDPKAAVTLLDLSHARPVEIIDFARLKGIA